MVDAPASIRARDPSESKVTTPDAREPPATQDSASTQSRGQGSHATSALTPREALHLDEIGRTRAFVRIAGAMVVLVALVLPFVGGDPLAKKIFWVGLGSVAVTCAWLGWKVRTDEGYTVRRALVVGYAAIFCAFCGVYFFGVFSPASTAIPFGLAFFSAGGSARGTLAVWLTCALGEAALAVLVITGVIADRGMVSGAGLGWADRAIIVTLVEACFAATYLISRAARKNTLFAIEQHDVALQRATQREALLKEARQDLVQALQIGGMGAFSELTIGSFKLGRVIGRGAMGEVYEGVRVGGTERAAVKLLHAHVMAQPDHVERFYREAKIVSSLSVPNVVRVIEVGDPAARVPYLTMEYLEGTDLSDHLRMHKRMGLRKVLAMVRQVGLGLDAARAAGVVHRDLKPRNLFLARQGWREVWKILDFGVSKLVDGGDASLTRDQIVGTPTYMAPEQARGTGVSHRTDLYALGVISYRALTGQPAFTGDITAEILYKVVHTMPPKPSACAPLAPEVDLVLALAMAKNPADRFDSAAEFADAMEAASQRRLDGDLRARAERLLARLPWGATE